MKKLISLVLAIVVALSLGFASFGYATKVGYTVSKVKNVKVMNTSIGYTYAIDKCIYLPAKKTFAILKLQNEDTGESYFWIDSSKHTTYKNVDYFYFNCLHEALNAVNSLGIEAKYTYNKKLKSNTTYTCTIKGELIIYDYEDKTGNKYIKWHKLFKSYTNKKGVYNFINPIIK